MIGCLAFKIKIEMKFHCPTVPGSGQQVCLGGMVVCKPILVFSLAQAEQLAMNSDTQEGG